VRRAGQVEEAGGTCRIEYFSDIQWTGAMGTPMASWNLVVRAIPKQETADCDKKVPGR